MTPGWKTSHEWIDRFAQDPDQLFIAIETWLACGLAFVNCISDFVNEESTESRWEEMGNPPEYFSVLGNLIVSYCDIHLGNLDATPLSEFQSEVNKLAAPETYVKLPDHHRLLALLPVCIDLTRRIEFVVGYRTRTSESDDVWQEESVLGEYGLLINRRRRLIRRGGYDATVELTTKPCCWAVFEALFDSRLESPNLELLKNNYPGDWNKGTAGQIYLQLRNLLKPLSMTVKQRQLTPIED